MARARKNGSPTPVSPTPATPTPVSPTAAPASRKERRAAKSTPEPAAVAAEAAAIYPDTSPAPPSAQEIAAEAYAIYQSRGGQHGRHEEDWLEAERRIGQRGSTRT